ncbi:MAG: hypothetical protein IID37_12015 [Planctomycetes bacterium]|nr:hypothetical protein [Planctomycetota bacterium]
MSAFHYQLSAASGFLAVACCTIWIRGVFIPKITLSDSVAPNFDEYVSRF